MPLCKQRKAQLTASLLVKLTPRNVNLGNGRFADVSARAGAVFATPGVGRGAAFGDVDNDGDVDVLVTQVNGPPLLLINQVGSKHHWIRPT